MFMTDYVILHCEAIIRDLRHACADRNGVRISQRYLKPAIRRREDWTNGSCFHVLQQVQPFEVCDSSAFKETEVSSVIQVSKRVHLSPGDGRFNHHGTMF